jgi:hypothetical protein
MNDEFTYVFLKLINGENIICTTFEEQEFDEDEPQITLPVIHPVQIFSLKIPAGEAIVEKFMMQPWIPFCDNNEIFEVPFSSIVFIGKLSENFIQKYKDYLEEQSHPLEDDFSNLDQEEMQIAESSMEEFESEQPKFKKRLH